MIVRRAALVLALFVGCSDAEAPPSVFTGRPSSGFDGGPERVCGVVPGSTCEQEGEIARCLCGSFEAQVGRFVCCRGGQAIIGVCEQANVARDCDGNLAASVGDAGSTGD